MDYADRHRELGHRPAAGLAAACSTHEGAAVHTTCQASAPGPLERVRQSCAAVGAGRGRVSVNSVTLVADAVDSLFRETFQARERAWKYEEDFHYVPDTASPHAQERTLAYLLALATINYGSGYAGWLRRNPANSTYYTVSRGLAQAFEPLTLYRAERLRQLTLEQIASIFGQDLRQPKPRELMQLFQRSLQQLGEFLCARYDGSAMALFEHCNFHAASIVDELIAMDTFDDRCMYGGRPVYFYKKAQLLAADVARVRRQYGWGDVSALDELTLFADNAVAQVLRVLGVLRLDASLAARIDRGEPLDVCSPEEVELRASSINAGAMLLERFKDKNQDERLGIVELDYYLWKVSHEAPYLEHGSIRRHLVLGEFY